MSKKLPVIHFLLYYPLSYLLNFREINVLPIFNEVIPTIQLNKGTCPYMFFDENLMFIPYHNELIIAYHIIPTLKDIITLQYCLLKKKNFKIINESICYYNNFKRLKYS